MGSFPGSLWANLPCDSLRDTRVVTVGVRMFIYRFILIVQDSTHGEGVPRFANILGGIILSAYISGPVKDKWFELPLYSFLLC